MGLCGRRQKLPRCQYPVCLLRFSRPGSEKAAWGTRGKTKRGRIGGYRASRGGPSEKQAHNKDFDDHHSQTNHACQTQEKRPKVKHSLLTLRPKETKQNQRKEAC